MQLDDFILIKNVVEPNVENYKKNIDNVDNASIIRINLKDHEDEENKNKKQYPNILIKGKEASVRNKSTVNEKISQIRLDTKAFGIKKKQFSLFSIQNEKEGINKYEENPKIMTKRQEHNLTKKNTSYKKFKSKIMTNIAQNVKTNVKENIKFERNPKQFLSDNLKSVLHRHIQNEKQPLKEAITKLDCVYNYLVDFVSNNNLN